MPRVIDCKNSPNVVYRQKFFADLAMTQSFTDETDVDVRSDPQRFNAR